MQVEKFKKDKIVISFFKPEQYILIFLFIYLFTEIYFSRVAQFSIADFITILSTKLRSGTIQVKDRNLYVCTSLINIHQSFQLPRKF